MSNKAYDAGVKLALSLDPFRRLGQGVKAVAGGAKSGWGRGPAALAAEDAATQAAHGPLDRLGLRVRNSLGDAKDAYAALPENVRNTMGNAALGAGALGVTGAGLGAGYAASREDDPTYKLGPIEWRGQSLSDLFNR